LSGAWIGQGERAVKNIDVLYVVIGALYLVIGMLVGIVMGIHQDFTFAPVHAHINLVGFSAHCLFGLVYKVWPTLKEGALAAVQFLLFVIGSPILLAGIAVAIKSTNATLAIIGSLLVILGAVLFFVIVARGLLRSAHP
jgi:hypothetical protein